MCDRFKHMCVDDLVKLIDYIVKYETVGSERYSVGAIKQRLNLTSEEYDEIYDLCMPAIRRKNAEKYWKNCYKGQKSEIQRVLSAVKENKTNSNNALTEIEFIINQESENLVNKKGVA